MLPADRRLHRGEEFSRIVREGRRAPRPTLVVHLLEAGRSPARVGFVVNKAVGGSVVRNRVARRLRAQLASRLHRLPPGALVVVRALPAAASASSAGLGADLDAAFQRLLVAGAA